MISNVFKTKRDKRSLADARDDRELGEVKGGG